MTFDLSAIIDDLTKLTSATCGILTLSLVYWKALPRIEEIHTQTNSLALKAEAAAHAMGLKEGLEQNAASVHEKQVSEAAVILAAAHIASEKLIAAAKLAKEQ